MTIQQKQTQPRSSEDGRPEISRAMLENVFSLAAAKTRHLQKSWRHHQGAPVFTVGGKYQARAWTQWTQGFEFGMALLVFDATGDETILAGGLADIRRLMPPHVSHQGVHDHGFNNISTYGQWRRLMQEGKIPENAAEMEMLELALKTSGAVQAMPCPVACGPVSSVGRVARFLRLWAAEFLLGQIVAQARGRVRQRPTRAIAWDECW